MNRFRDSFGLGLLDVMPGGVSRLGPDILYDGNSVAWYIADQTSTITQDVGNRVSEWRDYLGSGRDLLQANAPDRPFWNADGVGFAGVSQFMKAAPFVYDQPEQIYICFRQVTNTANDVVFDGHLNNSGYMIQAATPALRVSAGTLSVNNINLPLNTFGIARVLFNGAASTFQINETVQLAGDYGALDMDGFILGARGNGLNFWSNIEVKEVILRNVVDGAANEAIIYNYLATKHSI